MWLVAAVLDSPERSLQPDFTQPRLLEIPHPFTCLWTLWAGRVSPLAGLWGVRPDTGDKPKVGGDM